MTTQLDRLEALAESDTWDFEVTVEELRNALPDLIRVVRAAHQVNRWVNERSLAEALAPLYREVES